jgi:hypothetical protein
MAGPLPPLVGGMSTVIEDLSRSSLAREVDLVLFDTRKPTREGRHLVEALGARRAARLVVLSDVISQCISKSSSKVTLPMQQR